MRNTNKILLALAIGGTTLLGAPLAYADKYEVHNYYGDARYDDRYDDRYGRPHYRDNRGRKHKTVVHNHYYEPVRERVVVVERPVYVEEVRYEEPPRYYEEPAYYPPASSEYRSATPMIVGGIVGGVLGNQVGKGRGKDLATVAGVILGGSIGRDMAYRQ
jgi:hypothetical protein